MVGNLGCSLLGTQDQFLNVPSPQVWSVQILSYLVGMLQLMFFSRVLKKALQTDKFLTRSSPQFFGPFLRITGEPEFARFSRSLSVSSTLPIRSSLELRSSSNTSILSGICRFPSHSSEVGIQSTFQLGFRLFQMVSVLRTWKYFLLSCRVFQ